MKLSELCRKLTEQQQRGFINHDVWSDARRRQLTWIEALSDRQSIGEATDKLSAHAVALLTEMIRAFGAEPVTEERLVKEVRRRTMMSGAECDMSLAELEQSGILFAVVKVWGERTYFLPRDCFLPWQQTLFPANVQPVAPDDKLLSGPVTVRPVCRPLGKQLMGALAAMGRNGMTLTAKGVLAKKTIAAIEQWAEFDETTLKGSGLNWSSREHYSMKAAFMLEAAAASGLIQAEENQLLLEEDRLAAWLCQDEEARERRLLQWCLDLLLPVNTQSANRVSALCALDAGRWYRCDDIRALQEQWNPDGETGEMTLDWLSLLLGFGWMEAAQATSSGKTTELFRWKLDVNATDIDAAHAIKADPRRGQLRVQPNGELIVQPGCTLALHWELALLADWIADETVAIYRLTASSVSRALEFGRTKQTIRSWLEQASGQLPLPDTVEAMLEEWTSKACRSWFEEVTLLRCDDERMAEIVRSNSELSPMLIQAIGATDFIVNASSIAQIRKLLQRAGYPPQKALRTQEAAPVSSSYPVITERTAGMNRIADAKTELSRGTNAYSFLYAPSNITHYELASPRAQLAEKLQSQEEGLPSMWTKQLRVYHHSTRKELVERALAWQSPLQLRMDSELHSFVPERLELQGGDWAVVGILRNAADNKPIRLTPDMWDEMRIVVPGRSQP
ncbi:helicase-associated domain-containing protein [Paenibacillus harenae]|uniref:Helicase XPB/Ssl2 N-terminal domain-containing protein n=1 Tax=Paenibacillus harenae TaxID=306543 RepID=A0ABT9U008_PAEHA|nr:helicase-associated domain-containing protein [Paenibacillus harenae]MDQ0112972.1 hypothetical protein [Paenibacillus harenae]